MELVDKFKRYLREDGKSPKTIESYIGDICGFGKYLKSMGIGFKGEIKKLHVTRFKHYLMKKLPSEYNQQENQ